MSEIQRFRGADKDHLVYEIFLENFHPQALQLGAVQVRVQSGGKDVFVKELRGEELNKSFSSEYKK